MTEITLYRKYRPQNFAEVLGQDHIVKVIEGAIKLGNFPHSYLFCGSRGTGKTSIARIFAREIGSSQNDVYEIDAASNRGIDDIRQIRDSVHSSPLESPYKVYIIDEVHMLTKEAFNALLKVLEEPPRHVIFILATTEKDRLPETIVSRCQTYDFKKPTQNLLKELVLNIAKKEGFTLDPSSADLVAILGDGSFRDTQGILQKVIGSSKDKKISPEEVCAVTGAPRNTLINDLISAISEKDLNSGLKTINTAVEEGIDMKVFSKLVLRKLRAILLLRFSTDMKEILKNDFSDEDFKFLQKLSTAKDSNISSSTIKEILEAENQIGNSYISQLPIELALIKLIGQNNT